MSFLHRTSNKIVVGITSRSSEKDLQWLMDFIRQTFSEYVSHVKYLPITNSNTVDWEKEVRGCSVGILYHTKRQGRINIVDVDGALYDEELESLSHNLGKSKVLVVLDDLENCCDSERERILETQRSLKRRAAQLLLFPERGKIQEANRKRAEFLKVFGYNAAAGDLSTNTAKPKGIWASFSFHPISPHDKSSKTSVDFKRPTESSLKIIIFSRSAQSNYKWLMDWLRSACRVDDVRGVYITNNSTDFYSELPKCTFAVLYHTQKQGRLNLTDVTDSLYDEELRELSRLHGKKNVIVVIDDLQKIGPAEKERILRGQPSIAALARDLFLFKDKEKDFENLTRIKETLKGIGSENFKGNDIKLGVDNRSESVGKVKGSGSCDIDQYKSPRQALSAYTPRPSANYNSNSDVDDQPSASGVRHKEGSLHEWTKYRSPGDSDQSEEPAHKKPFLAQTNFWEPFSAAGNMVEDLRTKGAAFMEIFYKLSELLPFIKERIPEIQKKMQEMEETIEANTETIKGQQRTITTLRNEAELHNQTIVRRDNKIRLMEKEQEQKAGEIRELQSKTLNQDLIIAHLQEEKAEMQCKIQRLEEMLRNMKMEDQIHGQMKTMRQEEENIKGRGVSSVDPEEHPRMDEDSGIDQEERSAHTRQDKAETKELRVQEMRIRELERQLEDTKLNYEKQLEDTKLNYETELENTQLDYKKQLENTQLDYKKQLEKTQLDYKKQLEKTQLNYEKQLEKIKLNYKKQLDCEEQLEKTQLEKTQLDCEEQLENMRLDHKIQLEKTQLDYEKQLENTQLDYKKQLENTQLDYEKQLENTQLDYKKQLENTQLDCEEQLENMRLDHKIQLEKTQLDNEKLINAILDSQC